MDSGGVRRRCEQDRATRRRKQFVAQLRHVRTQCLYECVHLAPLRHCLLLCCRAATWLEPPPQNWVEVTCFTQLVPLTVGRIERRSVRQSTRPGTRTARIVFATNRTTAGIVTSRVSSVGGAGGARGVVRDRESAHG